MAQGPGPICPPEGPCNPETIASWQKSPGGLWFMPEGARPPMQVTGVAPQATGGPDDFGYTWDDSASFSWVDATTGTNSGLMGDDSYMGPIDIGFDFKFYENTYTQLYFNTNGLVTLGGGVYHYSNNSIPNTASPNNFVAPFWDDLCVNHSGYNTGTVYYQQGGIAPNRYFVIEWHQVSRLGSTDLLTFEVVLYESGDIVMQYLSLSGTLTSATVGIEDDAGVDGLQYLYNASGLGNNKAVRFYRPDPAARVKVRPLYQGRFTQAGETVSFQVPIRNTGELGSDTYDLPLASSWSATLYAADGATPLTDSDTDGTVDTGSVAQGSTVTVMVKVTTPDWTTVGDDNTAVLTVRSSLDTDKSKSVTLQTAVPAPFAQVYRDDADGAMSLYLARPKGSRLKKVTSDWYYGYDMAVAETPDGDFVYAWYKYRWTGSVGLVELYYTLVNPCGQTVRGVTQLTDHSGATMSTYDYNPAVAVASDGRIGVLWYRYLYDSSISGYLYNVYLAVLDASGNVLVSPTNLTNNTDWYQYAPVTYNVPLFWDTRIAATDDNRFVLAWQRQHQEATGYVNDIYYAVRDSNGYVIKAITKLTNDVPESDSHSLHSANRAPNNRAILTWLREGWDIYYTVVDSNGNLVKNMTNLTNNGEGRWSSDAVALSDGKILVGWINYDGTYPGHDQLAFAVLDSSYNRIAGPTPLNNPVATTGNNYVSVTADSDGHAILTWMDSDYNNRHNLYYALLNAGGTEVTPPMIFRTSQASGSNISTSYEGYGNTSYSQADALACRTYLPVTLRNYFVNPYEDYDSWENAYGPLAFGAEYQAYPDDDTDYYYFDLSATQNVTVQVKNYQATGDLILYKHREGNDPEKIKNWGKGGSTMTIGPLSLQPGKYYVRVYTTGGHNTTSLYTLTVTY